jgi:hypothetical protein
VAIQPIVHTALVAQLAAGWARWRAMNEDLPDFGEDLD